MAPMILGYLYLEKHPFELRPVDQNCCLVCVPVLLGPVQRPPVPRFDVWILVLVAPLPPSKKSLSLFLFL